MRQMLRPGALGRPRGMGWRGRWEEGSGWGTHVTPWLIHVNVWQNPLQYYKVISLQLIQINEKKIKKKKKNFPVCCDPHKGFCVINKAKVDVFLELSCFFSDPADVGNLISGSSAFSKSSLNMGKFTVHVLLKPGLENLEHYFASVWDECNCMVLWTFFGIVFLWDWNENWPFPVLWPLLSFPNLLAYWVQHFHSIIF